MTTEAVQPLRGVRVLDLSRILAGPLCTMVLADLGASVLKVEAPDGDETRRWGPPFANDVSAYFLALNRNKRSVTLDLSDEAGRRRLAELLGEADVLVENFRPGRMAAWGFDRAALERLNPRLVHCSITGFGEQGPYADYPGFDPVIEAMAGLMSINGPADRFEPYKVGVAVVDVQSGLYAASAVCSLLYRRDATGRGGSVAVPLYDVAIAGLVNVAQSYLVSRQLPSRQGNDHPNIVPFGTFATGDGLLMICAGNDRQWSVLCAEIGLDPPVDLADNAARVARRDAVRELVEEHLRGDSAVSWAGRLMKAGVPAAAINTLDRVLEDAIVHESGLVETVTHATAGRYETVGSPVLIDGSRPAVRSAPPLLGEANGSTDVWGEA